MGTYPLPEQQITTGSVTGPASYVAGGFVINLSGTYSTSLDFINLVVETPGSLPHARLEITRNSPGNGQATVKVMRVRYNAPSTPSGVPGGLPAGVGTSGVSNDTAATVDAIGGSGNAHRVNQLYTHTHSVSTTAQDTISTEVSAGTNLATTTFRFMAVGR